MKIIAKYLSLYIKWNNIKEAKNLKRVGGQMIKRFIILQFLHYLFLL